MASKPYTQIDVHSKPKEGTWPTVIPKLTAHEVERAFRRLWRFSTGRTYTGKISITTGNRRAVRLGSWRNNSPDVFLNPSCGWRDFVHDLSHWADWAVNGSTKHGPHHARFEAKLIREVLKRGYLEGKLAEPEVHYLDVAVDPLDVPRKRMDRIDELTDAWRRKLSRATNAIAKLDKERRRLAKKVAGADAG